MDETQVLIAVAGGAAALALIIVLAVALRRPRPDPGLAELARLQAETTGRLQAMGEALAVRQTELARLVSDRLDGVSARLGQSMQATTEQTVARLQSLHERLAVIDHAQKNLTDLSSHVTSLREVLGNKQARGAFGQVRMETIIQDGLPRGFYAFQHTLSNKTRPDCVIFLPDQRPLVIDAKFPLEAVTALRQAKSDEERARAAQRLRQDVLRHVGDIAGKYLLPGETQELALMFVPSESVYAELHEGFDDVVQKAYRARVVIVSPSLLMLAIQVMQQILRDSRMREAADRVRVEVARMAEDVTRLRERVLKLQQHYNQSGEDMRQILISSEKVERRAACIAELEFDADDGGAEQGSARLEAGE